MSPRLVTEWSTDDPGLAESLRMVAALPEYSSARCEAEAGLYMLQARVAWRRADQLREAESRHSRLIARRGGSR